VRKKALRGTLGAQRVKNRKKEKEQKEKELERISAEVGNLMQGEREW